MSGLDGDGRLCSDARMRLVVVILFALGCSGTAEPPERSGPSIVLEDFHSPDVGEPRETWTDGASGFSFLTPGSGWARVDAAELTAFGEHVKLAVRSGDRCVGWASARPSEGLGARAWADRARSALAWEGLDVQVDEDAKYDLWTARRYEVQGKLDGRVTSERASYWLDRTTVYAVVGRASDASYVARRRCLDQITAGFSLGAP